MLPVIFILTFMAVTLTIWGMFRPKPNVISRRIRAESYRDLTRERRLEGSVGQRVIVPAALNIGRLLARLLPHHFVRSIDQMLIMANQLSETFALSLRQVGLGRARRDALADVAARTGVPDLIRIAASVAQAEEMGTTLGDVLRVQAEDLRLVRRQRAQEAAQKAPIWITIPIAICFLPAMTAVVMVPSILHFLRYAGAIGSVPR